MFKYRFEIFFTIWNDIWWRFYCYLNEGKWTSAVGEIPINLVLVVQVCICSNGSLTANLQSDPNKV